MIAGSKDKTQADITMQGNAKMGLLNQREQSIEQRGKMGQQLNAQSGIFPAYPVTRDGHLMNFAFKWKHRDGSIVEFSAKGWKSDDPGKADRLTKINQLNSSAPAIAPGIRNWLQQYCELIEFRGSSTE